VLELANSGGTEQLLARVRQSYRPPPKLSVSQFADAEIVLTSGPLAGTRWQTDFAPYQRGIMDVFDEPGVQIAAVMGSSQFGKTAMMVNLCAFHIKHDPCNILVVQPTVDPMAKDFAKNRLDPVIEASPSLREVVSKKRAKSGGNTILLKGYRGGALAVGGANSASSLASRAVRLLILDEIDRYPPELPGEGSTLAIAMKRTTSFRRRRRIFMVSSPTLQNASIDTWFQRGDQRRFYVPCPRCTHMHTYQWANVKWDRDPDRPETARLHCPECDYQITDAERVAILEHGEWRPENPDRPDASVVSFHVWEAYSPLSSLSEIVSAFLRARLAQKRGDASEMHTWQNTTLGEPIEPDRGDGVEPHVLLTRRQAYPKDAQVPMGAALLTMAVDVQDERLEALIVGWGPGEESWLVDHHTLPGDTSQAAPWAELDELLERQYRHECGVLIGVSGTCIDSAGHRTTMVYDYALRHAARRVYAIIGRDGERPLISAPSPRRWGRNQRQVPLYTVGVDSAKALITSRLKMTEVERGYIHLPMADWCGDEFCAQLTSERLVTRWKSGLPVTVWQKIRPRNEALDLSVYALAALRLLNADLSAVHARVTGQGAPPPKAPADPTVTASKGPWLPSRRPGSWLRNRK
jgi:phage terminase large subunit GpA-like protein